MRRIILTYRRFECDTMIYGIALFMMYILKYCRIIREFPSTPSISTVYYHQMMFSVGGSRARLVQC